MSSSPAETPADASFSSSFGDAFADGHYEELSILDGLLCYTGDIINKQFEGEGILKSTREIYKGHFKANEYNGFGEWRSTVPDHPSGVTSYQGEWLHGLYHGKGTIAWSNGDQYTGPFVRGAPEGSAGTYTYHDGRVYVGDFVEGLHHGHGRLTQPGGAEYFEGHFERGVISGEGTASYNNGARLYQGAWKGGHKHYGTMRFAGSERFYTGHWRDDVPDGQHGHMAFANGDHYEGDFAAGKLQGVGRLTYATPAGQWYYGQFLKDRPHGKGYLYLPPASTSSSPDGETPQRGELIEGYFDGGALIDSTDTTSLSRVQNETAELSDVGPLPSALRQLADPSATSKSPSLPAVSSASSRHLSPPMPSFLPPEPGAPASVLSSPGAPLAPASASCKGWLEKYSLGRSKLAMVSNWKRRFFILAPFNDIVCLGYYEDELCDKPVGLLRLNPNKTRVVSLPSTQTHKKASKPGREVCIIFEDKGREFKLLLRAADVADHRRWVVALCDCFHTFDLQTDAPLDASRLPAESQ